MALRKPISYQWRLFIPLVAMLWFIIIALALFQYEREKTYRTQRVNDELRLINSRIIASYDQDIDLAPFMNFIAKYYENSVLNGIRVSIYDERGELLYCVGTPIPRYTSENLPPELADATEKGAGTAFRRSDENDKDNPYYYFGARTSSDGKIYVHTAMPYTLSLTQSMAVDESLWIIIIALAAIVSVIAYFTTRYLGKNISLLHDFANRAASDKDFNIDDDFPHDELGDISRQIISLYREKMEANERSEREHRIAIKATEEKISVTKQLTNNINHELKTPVGVIKGYLDTIADHPEMDEASRTRFIGKAQEHMERLCNMLNDLSTITRLEEGGSGVMRERVDFHELVFNVAAELKNINLTNGIKFTFDIPLDCYVVGNYNLLYGMLINLIRNADFHSHGTDCGIKIVKQNSREYVFSFYDNGNGVEEEHLPHLFDRFYTEDRSMGTGIGLHLVKEYIHMHGGEIRVESEPGQRTTFTVCLRKGKAHFEDSDLMETSVSHQAYEASRLDDSETKEILSKTYPYTILITEDDDEVRCFLERELSLHFKIRTAANGKDALRVLEEEEISLVVSDVMMPEMNGFELCRTIKSQLPFSHIPVILLTALTDERQRIFGITGGADDYIQKPFHTDYVKIKIIHLLQERQKLRERLLEKLRDNKLLLSEPEKVESIDDTFLRKFAEQIEAVYADPEYNVEKLSETLGLSRGHLHRKIKELTGTAPVEFLRTYRLNKATQLLRQNAYTVSEVAYRTGFSSPAYFSKCFKAVYGVTPTEYQ
mgnify:CR=1 FL=1